MISVFLRLLPGFTSRPIEMGDPGREKNIRR
jgi:hypothetical protein